LAKAVLKSIRPRVALALTHAAVPEEKRPPSEIAALKESVGQGPLISAVRPSSIESPLAEHGGEEFIPI
jgi:hypothetical protein